MGRKDYEKIRTKHGDACTYTYTSSSPPAVRPYHATLGIFYVVDGGLPATVNRHARPKLATSNSRINPCLKRRTKKVEGSGKPLSCELGVLP